MDSSGSLLVHPASLRVRRAQFSWQGGSRRYWHVSPSCLWDEILCFWCMQGPI